LCRYNGGIAQLYDIISLYLTAEFSKIQDDIYGDWNAFPGSDAMNAGFVQQLKSKYGITFSGQLYYAYYDGSLNPVVQFSNPNAKVVAKAIEAIGSADGVSNIDWQEMTGMTGQLATKIFQVFTKGGQLSGSVSISRSATAGRN
jgi:ABC-type branched-subunit amino acid transport system substrate-binding protein